MPLNDWTVAIVAVTAQSPTLDHYAVTLTDAREADRVLKDVIAVTGGENFAAKVREKIAAIEAADARRATLAVGVVDVTPPVVQPPDPPTPDELAKRQAQQDKFLLAAYAQEIALGVRKSDNAEYVALLAKVTKAVDDGTLDVAAAATVVA